MTNLDIGLPGHGKSVELAKKFKILLKRNYRWFKRGIPIRYIWSNLMVNEEWFKKGKNEKYRFLIKYWDNPMELIDVKDCDIIWDEIARHLDSRDWEKLHPRIKQFIQEHDKDGNHIYCNTQTPMQVDVMFRRTCHFMWRITRIAGCRRPSRTMPPVRLIWGLYIKRQIARVSFGKEESEEQFETSPWDWLKLWNLSWVDPDTCMFFDTHQKIKAHYPPLEHIEQSCPTCGFKKVHGKVVNYGDPNCKSHTAGGVVDTQLKVAPAVS